LGVAGLRCERVEKGRHVLPLKRLPLGQQRLVVAWCVF
jgi:hypothetical protein